MRLALDVPPGWQARRGRDRWIARAPAGVPARLEWTALVLLPTDVAATGDLVAAPLPPGARLETLRHEQTETSSGWPLLLVDSWVVGNGAVHEMRLEAIYQFRALGARALLRVREERLYFGVRQEVMPSLLAAAPDYRDALACVAQFWDEPDEDPGPAEDPDDSPSNPW